MRSKRKKKKGRLVGLYIGLGGLFWKKRKGKFRLKICVVNYLFSPWYRQVIPLTLMDNFMAANNICG